MNSFAGWDRDSLERKAYGLRETILGLQDELRLVTEALGPNCQTYSCDRCGAAGLLATEVMTGGHVVDGNVLCGPVQAEIKTYHFTVVLEERGVSESEAWENLLGYIADAPTEAIDRYESVEVIDS
jgi:hypothetical protein